MTRCGRENMTVLERDYARLEANTRRQFADVVLDERTCVVLQSVIAWTTADVEALVVTVATLSLKYALCWVVLYPPAGGDKSE